MASSFFQVSWLNVSAGASHDCMRNVPAARELLHMLHTETSVFSRREPPPERYLLILVNFELIPTPRVRVPSL